MAKFYRCWEKTRDPWVRCKDLYYSVLNRKHKLQVCESHGGNAPAGPGGCCSHSWEITTLGNIQCSQSGLVNCSPFLWGRRYVYYTAQGSNVNSLPEGDTISVFQGHLLCRRFREESPEQTLSQRCIIVLL